MKTKQTFVQPAAITASKVNEVTLDYISTSARVEPFMYNDKDEDPRTIIVHFAWDQSNKEKTNTRRMVSYLTMDIESAKSLANSLSRCVAQACDLLQHSIERARDDVEKKLARVERITAAVNPTDN